MPGWHARTENLVKSGKLSVIGIAEEQHPDRTALFMQWQEMPWPVMLDSLNLLAVKGIPHTLLIDEHGVIRFMNPKPADLESFLAATYEKPADLAAAGIEVGEGSAEEAILWKGESAIDEAVNQLQQRVEKEPGNAEALFRLGVACRRRYDSSKKKPGDFTRAVEAWTAALALDPNQYIWRRRIQQYGPRLDKPYSFYDWVRQAREEIAARGETPHSLAAEPTGSEFAYPQDGPDGISASGRHPDPGGDVIRDENHLVRVEATAVPSTKGNEPAYRVHLRFTPDPDRKVHWTNDAGALAWFAEEAPGLHIENRQGPDKPPGEPASAEERVVEFEIRPAAGNALPNRLRSAAFYYVCEDVGGQCLYLRQDIVIPLSG